MTPGYYRFPTICDETIVFTCEDDLWTVPAAGGIARRLTANPGEAYRPALSPDGQWLAYTGQDEGHPEVYLMPAMGGPARRLTFLGATALVLGWSADGGEVFFASNASQPFNRLQELYAISAAGGPPRRLPTGPAVSISYGPGGGAVIARHVTDLARWKRYRGGRTGDLWVDPAGDGAWRRLVELPGNLAVPLWVGERIYFVSDHEGLGHLYSVLPSGADLRRHSDHADYYVRHPATDGRRIVYHAGADLYIFDPASDQTSLVEVAFYSSQSQRKRRFVGSESYLQSYDLHPLGHSLALTSRGQSFSLGNWEGAPARHGGPLGRTRLASWLNDGRRVALISDASGEEAIELHSAAGAAEPQCLDGLDIGRPLSLQPSPRGPLLALTNQRNELLLIDLEAKSLRLLDRSIHQRIDGLSWSPDGRWLAYSFANSQQTAIIRLCEVESGAIHDATRTLLEDSRPSFDPEGNYLYFLSSRDFDPVYDSIHFDLSFPRSLRPYLITLRADLPSPFVAQPPELGPKPSESQAEGEIYRSEPAAGSSDQAPSAAEGPGSADDKPQAEEKKAESKDKPIRIDLDGIADRILAFPVPVGIYRQVMGTKGKALFTAFGIRGALSSPAEGEGSGRLEAYDFGERTHETLIEGVASFTISPDGKTMACRQGRRLRVLKAGEKPKENGEPSRRSGWVELSRLRVEVDPPAEWRQMYSEAWRLQRDHFWTPDMSGVDWQAAYTRYLPLLDRVATRSEFSDLIGEMQGELGTSHAYEMGGDYRREPSYRQGSLGLNLSYDAERGGYRIERIVRGDSWNEGDGSPLGRPGAPAAPGDLLLAINGRRLGPDLSPGEALVNQARSEVLLSIGPAAGGEPRSFTVKTLVSDTAARYRDWVEANRAAVHRASDGRIGYVHVPDMGARGYAEFHRSYLAEVAREAMIVDVRFNGGGHVSQLVLEKLARRRLGYDVSRWGQPTPYPQASVLGPMVALTNEYAGSDGDIFSHAFKLMGLGPLIGTRTWGGVIGISPIGSLIDGGQTTQPEHSFWFSDVGWKVENYGTEPTISVAIAPQDYLAGRDPQLERAISEVLSLMATHPPLIPDFGPRPRLGLPRLPDGE